MTLTTPTTDNSDNKPIFLQKWSEHPNVQSFFVPDEIKNKSKQSTYMIGQKYD